MPMPTKTASEEEAYNSALNLYMDILAMREKRWKAVPAWQRFVFDEQGQATLIGAVIPLRECSTAHLELRKKFWMDWVRKNDPTAYYEKWPLPAKIPRGKMLDFEPDEDV